MQTFGSSARPPAGSPQGNVTWSADLVVASGSLVHGRDGKLQGVSGPLHKPPPLMAPAFGMAVGQTTLVRTGEGNKTALIMVAHGYDWLPPIGRGVNKTTVYALRSDDNGASFRFLSRVPCLLTPGTNMSRWCSQNIGGPAEPALTQLADGRLLLLFRTTGTPLMKALSSDLGLTWQIQNLHLCGQSGRRFDCSQTVCSWSPPAVQALVSGGAAMALATHGSFRIWQPCTTSCCHRNHSGITVRCKWPVIGCPA